MMALTPEQAAQARALMEAQRQSVLSQNPEYRANANGEVVSPAGRVVWRPTPKSDITGSSSSAPGVTGYPGVDLDESDLWVRGGAGMPPIPGADPASVNPNAGGAAAGGGERASPGELDLGGPRIGNTADRDQALVMDFFRQAGQPRKRSSLPPMPRYAGPSQADMAAAYQESRRNRQTAIDYLRGAGPYNQMFTGSAVGQMLEEMALNPEGFTPEERAAIEDQINRGASNASAARDRALNRQLQRRGLGSSARGAVARAAAGYEAAQSRANQLANVEMQDAATARQRQQASIQSYLQQLGMEQSARQQGASFMANLSSPVFRGRAAMDNQGQQPQSRYEQRLAAGNQRQVFGF